MAGMFTLLEVVRSDGADKDNTAQTDYSYQIVTVSQWKMETLTCDQKVNSQCVEHQVKDIFLKDKMQNTSSCSLKRVVSWDKQEVTVISQKNNCPENILNLNRVTDISIRPTITAQNYKF
jgi:hypothetical protein